MRYRLVLISCFLSCVAAAQNLASFTLRMSPDSTPYLSIKNKKAYSAAAAVDVKNLVDLGMFETISGKSSTIEWYNLKPDNEKAPAAVWGAQTKIAAISFDQDQFIKCKTVADLKRMTGYLSTNALSHFAVVRNSENFYQRCFIFEREDKKRGLIFVTVAGKNWTVSVKSE